MIYIKKGPEPGALIRYRHQPNASFDDMDADVKKALRESLLKEQGYLCAYCMRRINDAQDTKIEHYKARTPENELQYHNLLAVCRGGEDGPPSARCCDTKKENRPLYISPLSQRDMSRIYYSNNGEVHSYDLTEREFSYIDSNGKKREGYTSPDQDLQDCLNLNYEKGTPMMGRRTALRKFQKELHPYKSDKSKRNFLEKMKSFYSEPRDELEPYVGILRWYIDKKLKQCK